jgi:CRP-like cAMP-binding protein
MKPREMMKVLRQGSWRTAGADECLVSRGDALDELMVIYSGKACVEVDGKYVTELQPGQFIGGISFITDEIAPANVVAIEPTRYFVWPISKLKSFLSKNPDLHAALQTTLAIDFTKWLHGSWARHPT